MPEWTSWPAPAKLNLFLQITGRRADGYHLLQTVFRLLDWGDHVRLRLREDGLIRREAAIGYQVDEQSDLAVRAAKLLAAEAKISTGVDIVIEKIIPTGGGFGGGSSNAGTVLVALNRLWELNWTLLRLAQLGLTLGADVPVFIHGRSAWAQGVGEQLTALELPPKAYLIADPAVHIATSVLFQAHDLTRDAAPATIDDFVSGRVSGNAFEPVARRLAAQIDQALSVLSAFGNARLTGSGSGCFVEFETRAQAEQAKRQLPESMRTWVCEGVNRSPLYEALDQFNKS